MKTTKTIATLLLTTCFALGSLAPRSAHALFLTDESFRGTAGASSFSFGPDDFAVVLWCTILLPICLFDGKAPAKSRTVSRTDLAEQGYTRAEIAAIVRDQTRFTQKLRKLKLRAQLAKGETFASLSRGIHNLYPQVSPTYVRFFADQTGVRNE